MKEKLFITCFFVFWALQEAYAEGYKLYLSPNGNDKNVGTQVQPLATLEGARDKIKKMRMSENITDTIFVNILPGTYYMTKRFELTENIASSQSPVVFRGKKEDRPVFCGGKQAGRFEVIQPGLWRTYIPEVAECGFYFEQLYVNGKRRHRAQTPNKGMFSFVKKVDETILDTTKSRLPLFASQKIFLHNAEADILKDMSLEEQRDALVVFYHKWDNTRKKIDYIQIADTAFYTIGKGMKPWNPIDKETRFVFENYPKGLDQSGEWFLQRDGYLYYMPMIGETIENTKAIYPVTEQFISISGTENNMVEQIRFENICFEVSAYRTPPEGNEPMQAASMIEAVIVADYARNIEIINCDIAQIGTNAVWFRNACSHSKVEHCHIYDLGAGGVKIGSPTAGLLTHHITVDNNIIQHGGYLFPCAVGVTIFHASDNQVTHNDIADLRYSGISVGWIWGYNPSLAKRNKIEFNHIHHLGWGELSDMGGVYTLGASEGTTVSNNVIHHVHSYTYGGWGLYTDEGSSRIIMENNLVYRCKNAGFHQHYGRENIIRNNIFAYNLHSQIQITRAEEHLSFSFTNNILLYNEGLLYMSLGGKDQWMKAKTIINHNCYWDERTKMPDFPNISFSDWKKSGKDRRSVIADPLFVNPREFDFHFRNTSIAKKIGFKPFDYSQAGIYGKREWKEKALLEPDLLEQFDKIMQTVK